VNICAQIDQLHFASNLKTSVAFVSGMQFSAVPIPSASVNIIGFGGFFMITVFSKTMHYGRKCSENSWQGLCSCERNHQFLKCGHLIGTASCL